MQTANNTRRLGLRASLAGCVAVALLWWPASALAHGLVGRAFLPVPAWLFAWAAAVVLIASFVALGSMWSAPRLERAPGRRLLRIPRGLEPLCGALGVAVFGLVVLSGLLGTQAPNENLAPTVVFVFFWVAVPVASVLLGDVFAPFNPWLALARAARRLGAVTGIAARLGPPRPYPPWLGHWPAVAGVAGFGWVELVLVQRDHPAILSVLAVAYAGTQMVGMALYGIDGWSERGDGFGVAFNLFSRLSAFECREHALWLRTPLSGLTALRVVPGTVALLCTMIGATTFDGAANGPVWRAIAKPVTRAFRDLGFGVTAAREVTFTLGLLCCVLLCAALYRLGVIGMGSVSADHPSAELARRFVHTLVPIAFGYLLAHYFSLLVTQGQAISSLISDPLGTGANIFGTANARVDYGLVSTAAIWYVQVAALVAGHVSGLALAHDRALVVYGDGQKAVASQRWMLAVMVSFTCLGLWLLSAVNT